MQRTAVRPPASQVAATSASARPAQRASLSGNGTPLLAGPPLPPLPPVGPVFYDLRDATAAGRGAEAARLSARLEELQAEAQVLVVPNAYPQARDQQQRAGATTGHMHCMLQGPCRGANGHSPLPQEGGCTRGAVFMGFAAPLYGHYAGTHICWRRGPQRGNQPRLHVSEGHA